MVIRFGLISWFFLSISLMVAEGVFLLWRACGRGLEVSTFQWGMWKEVGVLSTGYFCVNGVEVLWIL